MPTDEIVARLAPGRTRTTPSESCSRTSTSPWSRRCEAPGGNPALAHGPGVLYSLPIAERLAADAAFAWAEPNFLQEIRYEWTPDDPLFPNQWHLDNTGQEEEHRTRTSTRPKPGM